MNTLKELQINNGLKIKGEYTIKVFKAGTRELLRESKHSNLVVATTNVGLDLITQHLVGVTTYPLDIDKAAIGTGTTAPSATDTGLETAVLSNIDRADVVNRSATSIELDFFITDAELANGSYSEFGIFCNTQLFARSIINPAFTKASNEDTLINYQITFSSS